MKNNKTIFKNSQKLYKNYKRIKNFFRTLEHVLIYFTNILKEIYLQCELSFKYNVLLYLDLNWEKF